ncbi:MAG: hypothetical protein ACOYT7_02340 [Patescibacteria group bacterium]
MERVSEDILKEQANLLKKDQKVVGLWDRLLRAQSGFQRFMVVEEVDGNSYGLTLDKEGRVTEVPGKIIKKREQRGYPIRIEAFIPADGSDEIILVEHEF